MDVMNMRRLFVRETDIVRLRGMIWTLLGHFDTENDAAQELVAFVVVEQVRTLHLTLDGELRVIVVLGQQQLHGYNRLDVVCLMKGRDKDSRNGKNEKNLIRNTAIIICMDTAIYKKKCLIQM